MTLRTQLEAWEHALALLADDIYLDIVRNFIGRVPTPFHKPILTKRLTTLFSTEEFIQRIEASFSDLDRKLLVGAYILGTPTQAELCSLFDETIPYATVQQNVVNLEERLLLVPNPNALEQRGELMLNPLLRERLLASSLSTKDLFPPSADHQERYRFAEGDPKIIRALLSLHIHASLGTKERSERQLRNKFIKAVFGKEEDEAVELIIQYNRLLFHTQAVCEKGKITHVPAKRAQALLNAKPSEIQQLLFKTAWQTDPALNEKPIEPTILTSFFTILSQLLGTCAIYEEEHLLIAIRIAALKSALPVGDFSQLLTTLTAVGLTTQSADFENEEDDSRLEPTIDSDLTISFTQNLPSFDGNVDIYRLALVKKVDVVSSYEINKATILKAFDVGISVDEILAYLKRLTKNIPQSLKDLLGHWKQEYAAITIYDGIVVKADERLSRIIDALPTLQHHIIAQVGPGLYLFSRDEELQWREILTSTGIGLLPSSISETPKDPSPELSPLQETQQPSATFAEVLQQLPAERPPMEALPDFQTELLTLARKKAANKGDKEELEARIERKLLLVPSQVVTLEGHTKTMQASGFDFQGKVNLCKSTINSKVDLLELQMLDDDGNSHILLTEAKELISSTTANEASIRVSILPQEEEKVIPIAKVFRVRKLRRSIFFES